MPDETSRQKREREMNDAVESNMEQPLGGHQSTTAQQRSFMRLLQLMMHRQVNEENDD